MLYSLSLILFLALVSAAPSPEADTPKNDQNFSPVRNTIRNLDCIRSGNTGAVCHDGGKIPDPGAVGGKTACGTDALELGIIGIDHLRFGQQTGGFSPSNLCGRVIKITRVDSKGKVWTTTGRVMDRIRREQYEGPQIDLAPDLSKALGGNGEDNIENSQFRVEFLPANSPQVNSSVSFHIPKDHTSTSTTTTTTTKTATTTSSTKVAYSIPSKTASVTSSTAKPSSSFTSKANPTPSSPINTSSQSPAVDPKKKCRKK